MACSSIHYKTFSFDVFGAPTAVPLLAYTVNYQTNPRPPGKVLSGVNRGLEERGKEEVL